MRRASFFSTGRGDRALFLCRSKFISADVAAVRNAAEKIDRSRGLEQELIYYAGLSNIYIAARGTRCIGTVKIFDGPLPTALNNEIPSDKDVSSGYTSPTGSLEFICEEMDLKIRFLAKYFK